MYVLSYYFYACKFFLKFNSSFFVQISVDEEFSMMHHDIRSKKSRIALESRKVREIYEIDENDEKYEYNASN